MVAVLKENQIAGIERVPGRCGGYPVIANTRVAVRHVIEHLRLNGGGIADLLEAFPALSREQLEAALVYYAIFPDAVDEDIQRNDDAYRKVTGTI